MLKTNRSSSKIQTTPSLQFLRVSRTVLKTNQFLPMDNAIPALKTSNSSSTSVSTWSLRPMSMLKIWFSLHGNISRNRISRSETRTSIGRFILVRWKDPIWSIKLVILARGRLRFTMRKWRNVFLAVRRTRFMTKSWRCVSTGPIIPLRTVRIFYWTLEILILTRPKSKNRCNPSHFPNSVHSLLHIRLEITVRAVLRIFLTSILILTTVRNVRREGLMMKWVGLVRVILMPVWVLTGWWWTLFEMEEKWIYWNQSIWMMMLFLLITLKIKSLCFYFSIKSGSK